jgi:hypothetical protein
MLEGTSSSGKFKVQVSWTPNDIGKDIWYEKFFDAAGRSEISNATSSIAVIAVVAALALLGVVVMVITVVIIPLQQEAEARGCHTSIAFNASKGRCFHP